VQWLFLTRSLGYGGSQRQLVELLKGISKRKTSLALVTFYQGGPFQRELETAGIPVYSLNKESRWDLMSTSYQLLKLMRRLRPVVLHGYLGTSNILAVLAKIFWPRLKVVWGIRATNMKLEQYGGVDWILYWLECRLSRFSDLIIVNSQSGRDYAVAHGFPKGKIIVIHNGIDVEKFRPNHQKGIDFRLKQGIGATDILIGLIGRLDPMKGHEVFLRAASLFEKEKSGVWFVCVGEGQELYQERLRRLSDSLGLKRIVWLNACDSIEHIYNALDVLTSSSSYGEGFSNVIAEAMACGILCVATDVGDSKVILGDSGLVVPPDDVASLVSAWRRLLSMEVSERAGRRSAARARIVECFGVKRLIDQSFDALRLLGDAEPARPS
jgi:glycosyltransferase involved in cell wall biosynthesis